MMLNLLVSVSTIYACIAGMYLLWWDFIAVYYNLDPYQLGDRKVGGELEDLIETPAIKKIPLPLIISNTCFETSIGFV